MPDPVKFSNDFLDALGDLRKEVDISLIYFIHVVQSLSLSLEQKWTVQEKLMAIGDEMNAYFGSIRLEAVNRYNILDIEEKITKKAAALKKSFAQFRSHIDNVLKLKIDGSTYFSVKNIIDLLAVSRIGDSSAITRDKLDNIVSIKTFLLKVYEFQMPGAAGGNVTHFEKDFFAIKEKALVQTLRNSGNINPEYLFRSAEILKKRYSERKPCRIVTSEKDRLAQQEILFFPSGDRGITAMYAENGMSIRIDITKWEESGRASVGIAGYIEKGASRIDFSVLEQASPDHVEVVERLTGIDFILGLFELVYRESQIKADVQRKQDEQIRKTVNKAIDDILFG